ncbi:hypothetical protein IEZ26_01570 [Nocardioides cavernae]|uniref:PLD phosphodiesterase domain-containing protein n=1 Tax=Nocardioides cavernae TaxID=1921566 RepID=A0ABR8N7V7_9ACTN|nr:hypothetical protein [Nocardioides cavernae]MBD3923295.1 hypothetical protein [Nocardioides cavernae]MBM7511783.1 hypothetical protein [Nocardioides cavernae]
MTDLEVLEVVESRGGRVVLHDRLHAKYYRNDSEVLLGSANLTATALGWATCSNLELLIPAKRQHVRALEQRLLAEGIRASASLASEIAALALRLQPLPPAAESLAHDESTTDWSRWTPGLRHPSDLYRAYSLGPDILTSGSRETARADLSWLDLPQGLDSGDFTVLTGGRLLQHPLIHEVDELLVRGQRFGAMRDLLRDRLALDPQAADLAWQTLMRWLMEFLPSRYVVRTPNRSEVMFRVAALKEGEER